MRFPSFSLPDFLRLGFLKPKPHKHSADALFKRTMGQSRLPVFYERAAVNDDFDGRFDCLALHGYLVLRRLRRDGPEAEAVAQAFADRIFLDFDDTFREMGIGDTGVSRRVRKLAESFYGRVSAYNAAIEGDPDSPDLPEALRRNLYRGRDIGPETLNAMARYVRAQDKHLEAQPISQLQVGVIDFLQPTEFSGDALGSHA